ncbi:MAG: hypothetical protein PWQ67_1023 [Clostridia bacterium]|jgi:bacterioferritin-associated ferredoxin|nr:hypothetical protein [Clostridia bacterium]
MTKTGKCNCCSVKIEKTDSSVTSEYVCYCNNVTEEDIANAIIGKGAASVDEVIKFTGAMKNSNCAVNNPKGTCCYPDIVEVFKKYKQI